MVTRPAERGVILIIVLWIMAVLTAIAMTFARQAYLDVKTTSYQVDNLKAYYLARAGLARGMVFLREDRLKDAGVLHKDRKIRFKDDELGVRYDAGCEAWSWNPDHYEEEFKRSRYDKNPLGRLQVRVFDEGGRMDINHVNYKQLAWLIYRINGWEKEIDLIRAQMIAASIVDYIDRDRTPIIVEGYEKVKDEFPTGDDQSNEEYYYNAGQSIEEIENSGGRYILKNMCLDSAEELLAIKWMDPLLFFGEDANGNGILDPNEDDGLKSPPEDNADGVLQFGLKDFVTVYTGTTDGRRGADGKCNINTVDVYVLEALLYTLVGEDEDTARNAAETLVKFRNGPDREPMTDDDVPLFFQEQPFGRTVAEIQGLDEVDPGRLASILREASDYFEIVALGEVNGIQRELRALVERRFLEEDQLPELKDDWRGLRNRRSRLVGENEPEQAMINTFRAWEGVRKF